MDENPCRNKAHQLAKAGYVTNGLVYWPFRRYDCWGSSMVMLRTFGKRFTNGIPHHVDKIDHNLVRSLL